MGTIYSNVQDHIANPTVPCKKNKDIFFLQFFEWQYQYSNISRQEWVDDPGGMLKYFKIYFMRTLRLTSLLYFLLVGDDRIEVEGQIVFDPSRRVLSW